MKKFQNLSKFVNKAEDQIFTDYLMRILVLEIKLKSGEINKEVILPISANKSIVYAGEVYEKSTMIKDFLPKKALKELNELLDMSIEVTFNDKAEIKNWIRKETDITDCALTNVN